MSFLNPLHAYGFFSWHKIEDEKNFELHINRALQYALNLAAKEWDSKRGNVENFLIEQQFLNFLMILFVTHQ